MSARTLRRGGAGRMKALPAVLGALALALPAGARADDDDLLGSIYTENGYELRRDERVFALLSAFNYAGFDRSEQARSLPFPRLLSHPVRDRVRQALTADVRVRAALDRFLDTHPQPVEAYVAAALLLGDAPDFKAPAKFPAELAGLDKALADFARDAKVAKVSRSLATDVRAELKRVRPAVDAPFGALRAGYGLSEEDAPALVLMPTTLDSPALALARRLADDTHAVVFGLTMPDRAVDLKPALQAYSRLLAEEAAAGTAVEPLAEAAAALKAAGLAVPEARELLSESLRAAVEAKLWAADAPAEVEAAFKRGLVLARDFHKVLAEPADAADKTPLCTRVLAKADLKKAVAELTKAQPAAPRK